MTWCTRTFLALLAVGAGIAATLVAPASGASKGKRDVLVVSNNWAGTADLVDPYGFERVKRLDVIPDRAQRLAEIEADPTARFYYDSVRRLVGEGHDQYVDDGFVSRNGRVVYFSRPSFADVVAIDVKSGRIRWRTHVDGYRADHIALSPDGRRLLVSASTARVVDVLETRGGKIVGRIPSGDAPHENNFSRDGTRIFHASIGTVYTDTDEPSQDATKSSPSRPQGRSPASRLATIRSACAPARCASARCGDAPCTPGSRLAGGPKAPDGAGRAEPGRRGA